MTNLVLSGWVRFLYHGQMQTVGEGIVDLGAEEYISWGKVVIHTFRQVIDWFAIWYKDKDVNLKCASMIIHLRKGRKCDMEQPLLSTIYLQRHDSCLLSHPIICSYSVILLVILRTVWEPYGTHITTPGKRWMLFGRTVQLNDTHFGGTVLPNITIFDGTCPPIQMDPPP